MSTTNGIISNIIEKGTVLTVDVASLFPDIGTKIGDSVSGWNLLFRRWFGLKLRPEHRFDLSYADVCDRIMFNSDAKNLKSEIDRVFSFGNT